MEWLNYHHLQYFWLTAKEGGVAKAAARLRLAHPTVSGQIHELEASLGEKLFERQGRGLVLTEMGRVVYDHADEIFGIGQQLLDAVKGRPTGKPRKLLVGIADVLPKLIAKRLLDPARAADPSLRMVCREGSMEQLLSGLATHELDVVLSDAPLPSGSAVRAFNHLLGECAITLFATRGLAAKYRKKFPRSLDGAPFLLPGSSTTLRRTLDQWFDDAGIHPVIEAEFDDSALLKVFGQDGAGIFPGPAAIEDAICRQYEVEIVGRIPELKERFYAISGERRLRHPSVVTLYESARSDLFG